VWVGRCCECCEELRESSFTFGVELEVEGTRKSSSCYVSRSRFVVLVSVGMSASVRVCVRV
jgi:hypothetical protein